LLQHCSAEAVGYLESGILQVLSFKLKSAFAGAGAAGLISDAVSGREKFSGVFFTVIYS
jgi:hypothetical protein